MSIDLATFKLGLDIAKGVKDLTPKGGKDARDQIYKQAIFNALRTLFFTPTGVTVLLKQILAGEEVHEEELRRALITFNDGEPKVEQAAAQLLYDELQRENRISLRVISDLNMVAVGKLQLRRKIQNEINFYGRRGSKPDTKNVKELLDEIGKLNAAILDVEEAVGESKR